jgi:uncharacterized protein
MTNELITRSVDLDAVEFEGGDGRTLHARLFRWDAPSRVSDGSGPTYTELWERGVFAQSIKRAQHTGRGWPLMYNHDLRGAPIGLVPMVHERGDGPWMTAKISRTSLGNDIVELIKDGAIPGVSVNGRNIRSAKDRAGNIKRMEVALTEISVTPFPALVGADEMVLRAGTTHITDDGYQYDVPHSALVGNMNVSPQTPKRNDLANYLANLEPPPGVETLQRASKDPSDEQRKKWAEQGVALPDGSWPIPNRDYLTRAIQSFGRQAPGDAAKIKAWIKKRARALGAEDMIPEGW